MGVEGTKAVGGGEAVAALLAQHHINGTPQGVVAQVRRHHSLVHFNPFDHGRGNAAEREGRSVIGQGHPIDEYPYRVARHSVDVVIDPRTESPTLPYAHPGCTVRSEEHTSELQSRPHLVCRLL